MCANTVDGNIVIDCPLMRGKTVWNSNDLETPLLIISFHSDTDGIHFTAILSEYV